jgi:hypothetical protein
MKLWCRGSALLFLCSSLSFGQVTITGQVRSVIGAPVKMATVKLVNANLTRTTDDSGRYDFGVSAVRAVSATAQNPGYGIIVKGDHLVLTVDGAGIYSLALFDLSGRLLRSFPDRRFEAGRHDLSIGAGGGSNQIRLLNVSSGTRSDCYRLLPGNTAFNRDQFTLDKSSLTKTTATDSLVVTHPAYWGGLDRINTRKVAALSGTQNFRMFPFDTSATGWFASKMNFIFTPDTPGIAYYKQKVPDYIDEERETQREIQQCLWRLPADVPAGKKYATYNCNVNGNVTTGVASTGGNTLNLNPGYCNNKSWWEILGVQHHEMVHSYQQFYNTTGADGFGEAIPDAIRALCGFFYWPAGTKCSGGFAGTYQTGGKYWYFIELKHPGFIYKVMNMAQTGDIATRVQTITGDSLSTLCKECETSGMPYTLGRGSF